MSSQPDIEWFFDPNTYWKEYGLLCLAGKWAVVRTKGYEMSNDYEVITAWVDDRKTAVAFLKLLWGK